ncbi:universal stress protein [Pseudoxanthomonas sp. 10H]|uniref:universal stress protein n=1 Tax=Pseudoxanthomonas sp. 10H TaxID=3242729 RepID=UPI003557AFCC
MKILLAVDDSAVGVAAVRHVAKLAKALKTVPQLHVLNVVPRLSAAAEKEFGKAGPGRYYDAQWEAALGKVRPALKRTRLPFQERRALGEIVPSLLAEAKAAKADMIVIGSHGKGALKSLLVGSVTQKVVALSPVPVLVVN